MSQLADLPSSACFYAPSSGVTDAHCYVWLFILGIHPQTLVCVQQAPSSQSNLFSPKRELYAWTPPALGTLEQADRSSWSTFPLQTKSFLWRCIQTLISASGPGECLRYEYEWCAGQIIRRSRGLHRGENVLNCWLPKQTRLRWLITEQYYFCSRWWNQGVGGGWGRVGDKQQHLLSTQDRSVLSEELLLYYSQRFGQVSTIIPRYLDPIKVDAEAWGCNPVGREPV